MEKELNNQDFEDWAIDELKSLNTSILVSILNETFSHHNMMDDYIYPFDEDTINEMFRTPWDAISAFDSEDMCADWFKADNGHGYTTYRDYDVKDFVDDYIDEILKCCSQFDGGFYPQDYDVAGRILYLADGFPHMFSDSSLEYIKNNDISDFVIEDFDNCHDDFDFIEAFEEYVEDKISEDSED